MSDFDILVLGDANPDLVLSGGDVVPAFGQAERLVDEARLVIGGSGAIFACGAAKLGLRVAFAGVVGDDMFGRFMCDQLQAHGIDTSAVAMLPERSTGVTVVLSGRDDRAMLTFAGTTGDLRRSVIGTDVLSRTRHIHVSSYFLQRALAPELPALFREARDGEATTSLDPNWDPSGQWDNGLMALLPEVDVFLPNEVEALSMARISVVEDAIARLRSVRRRHGRRQDRRAGRGGGAGGRSGRRRGDPHAGRRLHRRRRFVRRGFPRGLPRRAAVAEMPGDRERVRRAVHARHRRRVDAAHHGRGLGGDRTGLRAVIVCLVANPSIDKLFEVDRLVRGDIHRPIGFEQTAGGKGLNVARAAGALGGDVRAVALFRGHTGKWLEETLSSEGVHGSYVWTHGENRSSLSVADRETGGLTEFYEHGSEVPSSAWPELAHATAALFGDATWLTISGSLPAGIDDSAYRDLVAEARDAGVRVALDAEGDRLRLALEAHPDVVKVNASEASELLGVPTARRDEAMAAAQKLRELAGGDGHVGIVTRGADGVVVAAPDGALYEGVLYVRGRYPVGSGDAFLAGLVVALDRGTGWGEALRMALGAATANAELPGAGRLDRSRAEALAEQATVRLI